jgi:hypothetical protein
MTQTADNEHSGETAGSTAPEDHFRWAYRLLIALAKRCQQDEDSMHAGQEWSGLVGTSHAMYLQRAREEAGIDHDEFLRVVREQIDVEDIYDEALQ